MPGNNVTPEVIEAGAQAIHHATPRNCPFDKLTLVKKNRLRAEAAACIAVLADHVVGWRTIDSAPKDGSPIAVIKWWPSYDERPGKWSAITVYAYEQDSRREQCWVDANRSTCIREDSWTTNYRWAVLPNDLPAPPTPAKEVG